MAETWTHLRIPAKLLERLKNLQHRIDKARVLGHPRLQDEAGELPLYRVVERLVREWESHTDRAVRSARRRKARRGYLATPEIRGWYRG